MTRGPTASAQRAGPERDDDRECGRDADDGLEPKTEDRGDPIAARPDRCRGAGDGTTMRATRTHNDKNMNDDRSAGFGKMLRAAWIPSRTSLVVGSRSAARKGPGARKVDEGQERDRDRDLDDQPRIRSTPASVQGR